MVGACPSITADDGRKRVGVEWQVESHIDALAVGIEGVDGEYPWECLVLIRKKRERAVVIVQYGRPVLDEEAECERGPFHDAVLVGDRDKNEVAAMANRERPTVSIPRLVGKIGFVHVCDAAFSEQGVLREYKPLGQGDAEVARQIELLKGLLYDGYLVFEWPKTLVDTLPEPQVALPKALEFLRERLDAEEAVLSAYKGDKRPVKMASLPAGAGGT